MAVADEGLSDVGAVLVQSGVMEILKQNPEPALDALVIATPIGDLVHRQLKVLPEAGLRHLHQDPAVFPRTPARRQVPGCQPAEQVVQLVEDLHGGGGVVDAGRQRPLGDVHELPQAEADVLVHAALPAEQDRPP